MSPGPARCSCSPARVADNVVTASAQLVDHLLTTVSRMDVHLAECAGGVVEAGPARPRLAGRRAPPGADGHSLRRGSPGGRRRCAGMVEAGWGGLSTGLVAVGRRGIGRASALSCSSADPGALTATRSSAPSSVPATASAAPRRPGAARAHLEAALRAGVLRRRVQRWIDHLAKSQVRSYDLSHWQVHWHCEASDAVPGVQPGRYSVRRR